jgi:hypothetical protein
MTTSIRPGALAGDSSSAAFSGSVSLEEPPCYSRSACHERLVALAYGRRSSRDAPHPYEHPETDPARTATFPEDWLAWRSSLPAVRHQGVYRDEDGEDVVTCIGQPPTSVDAWLATVNQCLVEYRGQDWVTLALTGLIAVAIIAAVTLTALALLFRR